MREMFDAVQVGSDAPKAAITLISRSRGHEFHVLGTGSTRRWLVTTRPRFMQDNWVLMVCVENEAVQGKRIGMVDDITVRPDTAPESQGTCNA